MPSYGNPGKWFHLTFPIYEMWKNQRHLGWGIWGLNRWSMYKREQPLRSPSLTYGNRDYIFYLGDNYLFKSHLWTLRRQNPAWIILIPLHTGLNLKMLMFNCSFTKAQVRAGCSNWNCERTLVNWVYSSSNCKKASLSFATLYRDRRKNMLLRDEFTKFQITNILFKYQ